MIFPLGTKQTVSAKRDQPKTDTLSNTPLKLLPLTNCPSLMNTVSWVSNDSFAERLLILEKDPPGFQKARQVLEFLDLSQKQSLELQSLNCVFPKFQKGREVLETYLVNNLLLPLYLEGFIAINELIPYKNYLQYVAKDFLNWPHKLINLSLEDRVKYSLARALKENQLPFQDYTKEDIEALVLQHVAKSHPLGALRCIDMHCSHLGYRPVLNKFVGGLFGALREINLDDMRHHLFADLFPTLNYFIFFYA